MRRAVRIHEGRGDGGMVADIINDLMFVRVAYYHQVPQPLVSWEIWLYSFEEVVDGSTMLPALCDNTQVVEVPFAVRPREVLPSPDGSELARSKEWPQPDVDEAAHGVV